MLGREKENCFLFTFIKYFKKEKIWLEKFLTFPFNRDFSKNFPKYLLPYW